MTSTTVGHRGPVDQAEHGDGRAPGTRGASAGRLSREQRRFLVVLGLPALGMALTVTIVSTYLPALVGEATNAIVVGALIGGEGFFGIFMPGIIGSLSDRTARTVRDRFRLLLPCAGVVVVSVAAVGMAGAWFPGRVWAYALALALLYAGYYAFLAPYWSLYPDLVPDDQSGRSRSAESTWRVTGVGLALVGGGLLLDLSPALPFLVAAGVVVLVIAVLTHGLRDRRDVPVQSEPSAGGVVSDITRLLGDAGIRNLCIANALWNFALASLRAFVVLFFTIGMDRSATFVSTVIFPLVAVGIAIGAPASGWVADRWGHVRLLALALVPYALGMALPGFTRATWVIGVIPPVALGAAVVMTLPFSALMRLLPPENHGAASGLFGLSRGVGATLGPLLTGVAIVTLAPVMPETSGYAAMWLACSAALVTSLVFLLPLRHDRRLR